MMINSGTDKKKKWEKPEVIKLPFKETLAGDDNRYPESYGAGTYS
jgi:hypothetical protein